MPEQKEETNKINILDYYLNPKMEIIDKKSAQKILDELKVSQEDLPKMNLTDPLVKELNAKKGDIVRIKRKDVTGEYYYYRAVV